MSRDLRQRKKAARAARKAAKRAQRREHIREKLDEARYGGDIRRNTHVEKGREVVVNDIIPYYRPKCTNCTKGILGIRVVDGVEHAEPCRCATTRFYKAHPEIIVEGDGRCFWPAGGEPGKHTVIEPGEAE